MVHYDENYLRGANTLGRLFRRIIGIACLIAVPGIWIAVQGALPEARILGLGLSVIVMGLAGLCFLGATRR
ncbi:hypothetical protein [uncultured Marivita sp.]|uniref:hypothetical protein n=1 Tax=uncultured Marivita sp. TaxID=888080 RepID=UPI00263342B1|nr:hypothetical protein [uncultured Marivita sp.]